MAFKVDFSSSLAASTPPAAPSKTKFQIAGVYLHIRPPKLKPMHTLCCTVTTHAFSVARINVFVVIADSVLCVFRAKPKHVPILEGESRAVLNLEVSPDLLFTSLTIQFYFLFRVGYLRFLPEDKDCADLAPGPLS